RGAVVAAGEKRIAARVSEKPGRGHGHAHAHLAEVPEGPQNRIRLGREKLSLHGEAEQEHRHDRYEQDQRAPPASEQEVAETGNQPRPHAQPYDLPKPRPGRLGPRRRLRLGLRLRRDLRFGGSLRHAQALSARLPLRPPAAASNAVAMRSSPVLYKFLVSSRLLKNNLALCHSERSEESRSENMTLARFPSPTAPRNDSCDEFFSNPLA